MYKSHVAVEWQQNRQLQRRRNNYRKRPPMGGVVRRVVRLPVGAGTLFGVSRSCIFTAFRALRTGGGDRRRRKAFGLGRRLRLSIKLATKRPKWHYDHRIPSNKPQKPNHPKRILFFRLWDPNHPQPHDNFLVSFGTLRPLDNFLPQDVERKKILPSENVHNICRTLSRFVRPQATAKPGAAQPQTTVERRK